MFRPTPSLQRSIRRLALTTKQASKDYYKGNRTGSMGQHTKWGTYVIKWGKVRTYVVPEDLASFTLTPFVTKRVEKPRGPYKYLEGKGRIDGKRYLEKWKVENGAD
ncbi:hypothetical protein M501DRAFT_997962 [Patellaria atrata CBS 101060]|uniref:50S ribosomal protein YmL27 n=1 Tax=Patellaria atrata CBS 101060 TaxID=1346257 RepID=A0A9P4SG66_9PEZI|nr:hypothetical protein M501DRAFT_997962 [Patellaria atrata CBS 101060]